MRVFVIVGILLALAPGPALAQQQCVFQMGFANLRQSAGAQVVGECLANERFNVANGNAEQPTTSGLMVWRKADNWTAFTNGYETWINGPAGLQSRLNKDRFEWESDTPAAVAPSPAAVAAPATAVLSVADVAALIRPSVVQIWTATASGSGVGVAEGIVTNAHVVEGFKVVELTLADGRTEAAAVLRVDSGADLALLSSPRSVPPLSRAGARQQRQGDTLIAFGYPRSAVLGASPTLTTGVLSAIRVDSAGVQYIQTDAAINPGSSGGALVNLRGELVGVPTLSLRDAQNIGLAIAAESIENFLAGRVVATPAPLATPGVRPSPSPARPQVRNLMLAASALGSGFVQQPGTCADGSPSCTLDFLGTWPGFVSTQLLELPEPSLASESLARYVSASLHAAGLTVTEIVSVGPPGSRITVATDGVVVTSHMFAAKGPYRLDLTSSLHRFGYSVTVTNWLGDVMKAWYAQLPA
ncbi:MAG: S1C family serine protease [Chloroflexota bacterium]